MRQSSKSEYFPVADARAAYKRSKPACAPSNPTLSGKRAITREMLAELLQRKFLLYDKGGEEHYNLISGGSTSPCGTRTPDVGIVLAGAHAGIGRRPVVHRRDAWCGWRAKILAWPSRALSL